MTRYRCFPILAVVLTTAACAADGTAPPAFGTNHTAPRRSAAYSLAQIFTADRNCSDFATPAEAQQFFLDAGGPKLDPHDLDRDGDGNACEWGKSPGKSAPRPPASVPARVTASGKCHVGPRGGTYTITASGNKNYGGC